MDHEIGVRQRAGASFGPLDEDERAIRPEIAEAEPLELTGVGDAIEIEMMRIAIADAIRLDQAVSRTLDTFADAERAEQLARERRLAGAELAFEIDHAALARERRRETRSD